LWVAREQVFILQFVQSRAKGGVRRVPISEKLLVSIVQVLRDLFRNFAFPLRRQLQRSKAA
jgi:hypothetical protein